MDMCLLEFDVWLLESLNVLLKILMLLGVRKEYCPVWLYSCVQYLVKLICFISIGKELCIVEQKQTRVDKKQQQMWLSSFLNIVHLRWVTLSLDLILVGVLINRVTKTKSCDLRVTNLCQWNNYILCSNYILYIIDCTVQIIIVLDDSFLHLLVYWSCLLF